MKSCPSVGLLAVIRYPFTPPFQGGNPNFGAPPLQWDQSATFASLIECTAERDRQLQGADQESQRITAEFLENPDQYLSDVHQFSSV